MIGALLQALRSPAEVLATGLVGVAAVAGLAARRWPRAAVAASVALGLALALGLLACGFRDLLATGLSDELAPQLLAGGLARKHADAARALWWTALCAAPVVLLARGRRPPPTGRAVVAPGLLAAGLLVPAAVLAPEEPAWTALAGVAWAAVARLRGPTPDAALLLAAASFAGADARLYHDAALYEVADVARFGPDLAAWWLSTAAAVAWLAQGLGPGRRWRAGVALGAVGAGLFATRGEALGRGPDPALAALVGHVPRWTPLLATRVPWGCLVTREGEALAVAPLARPWREPDCPARGAFVRGPRAAPPILAVDRDEPTTSLAGWYAGAGEVELLVELEGVGLPEWRLVAVPFEVWPGPVDGAYDPAGRPGPSALLLSGGVLRGAASSGLEPVPLGPDRRASIASAAGDRRRVDLLLPAAEVPTVGDLLDLCADALAARPTGLRCVVATGDWSGF